MSYTPQHLKLWEYPATYIGTEWYDHYVALSTHGSADLLTESNFAVLKARLQTIAPETPPANSTGVYAVDTSTVTGWTVVHEKCSLVRWVQWIAIHKDAEELLRTADEAMSALEQYPILDEDDFSEREHDEYNRQWQEDHSEVERRRMLREYGLTLHDFSRDQWTAYIDGTECPREYLEAHM